MRDSAARLLLLLSEYHPLVIEGMGSYDARAPGTVAATVSRLLRQRWEASPPGKPVILVTQGDPLAARGISAITRAVASELSLPRALVCLDDSIDPSHSRDADRDGVILELRYSMLAGVLEPPGAAPASLAALTRAVDSSLAAKNAAREAEGKPRLKEYYRDYALLQEVTKAALRAACGGVTVAHTAEEISPFSVTSFYEAGLAVGAVFESDMVRFTSERECARER